MIVDADCIQFELGGDKKVIVGGILLFYGGNCIFYLGGDRGPCTGVGGSVPPLPPNKGLTCKNEHITNMTSYTM